MKQKVLIVEDDATSSEIICFSLKDEGYDLTVVTDGETAYRQALTILPDIVLMDVKMPNWDGYDTCRAFKSNHALAGIPIIFVTAVVNDIENAFEAGGVDYVSKPLREAELQMRVGFHLERLKFVKDIKKLNLSFQRKIQNQTAELSSTKRKLASALAELDELKNK